MTKNNLKQIIFYLLGIAFIFFLWWIGSELQPNKIPSILSVFKQLFNESHTAEGVNRNVARLLASGEHAFWGLLLSSIISFVIVLIISLMPNFEFLANPLAIFIKATPVVALVPLFMMFFKSEGSYIAASVAISFFPIYIAGVDGLKRVPDKLIKLAEVYHTSRWNQFLYFKSGYVIESMLSALQISAPLSMVGAVVGEYVIGGNGYSLGIFIASNTGASDYEARFVAIILSLFAGIVFYLCGFFIHKWYAQHVRINKV
jgi:ABC-type nitrate/sulfonate/bicarbonate transport system permease component